MDVQRFNEVYHQFITNLVQKYKLGQLNLLANYDDNIKSNDLHYLDTYLTNIFPYIDEVSACNIDFFRYTSNKFELIDGLSIKTIINKLVLNKKKRNYDLVAFKDLCTYLMTLYLVILRDDSVTHLKTHLIKYKDHEYYEQMLSVVDAKDEIIQNWKENNNDEVKFEQLKKEESTKAPGGSGGSGNNSSGSSSGSSSSGSSSSGGGSSSGGSSSSGSGFPFGGLENTEIGKLASELAATIEGDGNMELPDISNPSDIFGMLFGGGGDKKGGAALGNIMTKVCSELDSKIKSGELDQNALFKEAQGLMGGAGGMFNPPAQQSNNTEKSNNNSTSGKKIRRKKKKRPVAKSDADILDETADDMGL